MLLKALYIKGLRRLADGDFGADMAGKSAINYQPINPIFSLSLLLYINIIF